jgi:flagellar motor switch protein FliM
MMGVVMNQTKNQSNWLPNYLNSSNEKVPLTQNPETIYPSDLVNTEKLNGLRMPGLELIHERFARSLKTDLFSTFRRATDVQFDETKISRYADLMMSLVDHSSYNIAHIKSLRGACLFIISAQLIYAFVEYLFGGDGRFLGEAKNREFSQTEQRLIQRILELIFSCYSKVAETTINLNFEYVRSESNPEFVNIADPDEMMIVSVFRLQIANISGNMHICIPWKSLEPLRHKLMAKAESDLGQLDQRWTDLLAEQITYAEIELIAILGEKPIKLADVLAMKTGEVITLPKTDSIQAIIDGVPIFKGRFGKFNEQFAIEIDERITNSKHPKSNV